MKVVINPSRNEWSNLIQRADSDAADVSAAVKEILNSVRIRGDAAVTECIERFEGKTPVELRCSVTQRDIAARTVSESLQRAISTAIRTISTFHSSQQATEDTVETAPGIRCFRQSRPIERVGLYVPGGTAPLFSTLLMLAIPARIAGVKQIALVTPSGEDGRINPAVALCAQQLGIEEIYLMGGAQAIAALGYGTQSIPKVSKIAGPGNRYVTEAKVQLAAQGIAIDMPAGPSEVLVIADPDARPDFIAADLLAQAEHGADSDVVFVTTDLALVERVQEAVVNQLRALPRESIASSVLSRCRAIVCSTIEEALDFSNAYAPEHLILSVSDAERYVSRVINAGSVFLGYMAAESLGDYASGTNHVLPTNGCATAWSGVSVDTFVKKITFQTVTDTGLRSIADTVIEMANAEGLQAHARAVSIRKEAIYA